MPITKLPLKKLIEFRRLTPRSKNTFSNNLKRPKKISIGSGGDYWIRCISAISMAFKENDNSIVRERLDKLEDDYALPSSSQTKTMRKRNIDILQNYVNFDFSLLRPSQDLEFLSRPSSMSVVEMNSLPIQILPNHIFSYGSEDDRKIGGIWFITWQEGFKEGDMGIYSEALFRYLTENFSEDFYINPSNCIIVDISNMQTVRYSEILDGYIPSLIDETINDINKYLK